MASEKDSPIHLNMICSVCGGVSNGSHFGSESCRACAAFFRRTVALKLRYTCRGNKHCVISKELRCLCRFCRYEKCVKVGMRPENVQLNRFDPLPAIKPDTYSSLLSSSTTTTSSTSTSSSSFSITDIPSIQSNLHIPTGIQDRNSVIMNSNIEANACQQVMATIFNRIPQDSSTTLIGSMQEAYRRMIEKRKLCQRAANSEENSLKNIFEAGNFPKITNVTEFSAFEHVKATKMQLMLLAEFCVEIKYFSQLSTDKKLQLFKRNWRSLMLLDRAYETSSLLGFDESDTRVIIYNYKAFDVYQVKCTENETKNMPRDEIQRLFSPSIKAIYEQVVRPIKRLKPSEFEYLTMMGLIIWKCENTEINSISVEKAKSELLESLHNYFINEKKLFCYAQRLTEIMEIISAIEKAIDKTNEDAVLSQLFDVFQCDIYFSKLFDE